MISNLVDTGSQSLGEQVVVQTRGTFLDFSLRPAVSSKKKRSGSAPPRKGVFVDEGPTCSDDTQCISEWIERAMRLSGPRAHTQQEALDEKCAPCVKIEHVDEILNTSLVESHSAPIREPFASRIASRNAKCDSFDFKLGSWRGDAVPDPQPTLEPRLGLEVPGPYKRFNLARNGPSKDSCYRWLEETIRSKQPPQETPQEVTTLMICDIPCHQTIQQIIDAINQQGFTNTYDFVYMPLKRPKYAKNMGYAFLNFKTAEYAKAFGEGFQNFRFPNSLAKKLSYTKPACHQGYAENVDRYIKQGAVGCLLIFDDAVHDGEGQKMCQ